jgi:ABC-type Fe3+-siderophore transport system permease subunit
LFVGLIIPNLLRSACRADHRLLVPASALAGAVFMLACDICTRLVPSVGIIPLGVVTGLIGAPVFIVILIRQSRIHAS